MIRLAKLFAIFAIGVGASASHAEPVFLELHSPLGLFGDKDGVFLETTVDKNGITTIEYNATGELPFESSPYTGLWPEGVGWTKLIVRRSGQTGNLNHVDFFNPFGTMDRVQGIQAGVDYLPPNDINRYQLIVARPFGSPEQRGSYFLEFWVESILPPIVGDFNFDDVVDLADFLILSENFHRQDNDRGRTRWDLGDADLDDDTDFADFLLMSTHFGESRVATASVPEPTFGYLGSILAVIGLTWRQQRCTIPI